MQVVWGIQPYHTISWYIVNLRAKLNDSKLTVALFVPTVLETSKPSLGFNLELVTLRGMYETVEIANLEINL